MILPTRAIPGSWLCLWGSFRKEEWPTGNVCAYQAKQGHANTVLVYSIAMDKTGGRGLRLWPHGVGMSLLRLVGPYI